MKEKKNHKLLILPGLTWIIFLISVAFGLNYLVGNFRTPPQRLQISKIEKKRKAVPWSKTKTSSVGPRKIIKAKLRPINSKTPRTKQPWEQTTQELSQQLELGLDSPGTLRPKDIEKNSAIVDEILLREPDSYASYKAKLILLLAKEAHAPNAVTTDDIENIMEELASFDVYNDAILREEAFLIAKENNTAPREFPPVQVTNADESPDIIDDEEISEDELSTFDEITADDERPIEQIIYDQDLLEVWLQRGLAIQDYEFVMNEAQYIIDEFPQSLLGYKYVIRALELSGELDAADEYIAELELSPELLTKLQLQLKKAKAQNPKDFWKNLKF